MPSRGGARGGRGGAGAARRLALAALVALAAAGAARADADGTVRRRPAATPGGGRGDPERELTGGDGMGPVQEPCGVEPEEGQLELYIKRLEKKVEQLQARLDGESIYCAPQWLEEGLDFALENLEKVTAPVRAPIAGAYKAHLAGHVAKAVEVGGPYAAKAAEASAAAYAAAAPHAQAALAKATELAGTAAAKAGPAYEQAKAKVAEEAPKVYAQAKEAMAPAVAKFEEGCKQAEALLIEQLKKQPATAAYATPEVASTVVQAAVYAPLVLIGLLVLSSVLSALFGGKKKKLPPASSPGRPAFKPQGKKGKKGKH